MEVEARDGECEEEIPEANSSSDSDEGSDDDESEHLKLKALEKELSENPSSYETHVEYIRILRKLGHIEKLTKARESTGELFPLSPQMWQEWARDEASLSRGPEAFNTVMQIYERAVKEYLSVPLWCEYINFVQEHSEEVSQCAPHGIVKMRDLLERALTAAGLHIVEGSKIWNAYREFEQAIEFTIDDSDVEEKAKQVQRIRSLFHRELSVPLADMRSTLAAYKQWEAKEGCSIDSNSDGCDGLPPHVVSSYQKALQMLNDRVHYEDQISHSNPFDAERLNNFMSYIKFEDSSGDPARVQLLYERAITEFPVSSDLWLSYTRYVDKTLKAYNVATSIYSRAIRNCPWVAELWIRYLLSLERVHASETEISNIFERSLQCGFSSYEEYLDLFLTRIDGLRRRLSLATKLDEGLNYALLRETFQYASDYLSPHLKSTDRLLSFYAYWARLELSLGADLLAARGVWESLIKTNGAMTEVWKGYIAMEIEQGHINEARSIYKRCYSKRFLGNGSEDICYSWLSFEREFGSLEDLVRAEEKVTPRLEQLQLYRQREESKNLPAAIPKGDLHSKKSQKRKLGTSVTEVQPRSKRYKDVTQQVEMLGEDNVESSASFKSNEGINLEPLNASIATNMLDTVDATNGKEIVDQSMKGDTASMYPDQCTAFISNISLEANEEDIRKFFSDIGGVTAIRLLKNKFTGDSRGLAYVDFSDDSHLEAAVAKNKQKLRGQKLSIARSDPTKRQKQGSSGSNSARGRGRGMPSARGLGAATSSKESSRASKGSGMHTAPVSFSHRRGGHAQLTGKNTFAMPRNVARSLRTSSNEQKNEIDNDKPKSNDEFRKLIFKN